MLTRVALVIGTALTPLALAQSRCQQGGVEVLAGGARPACMVPQSKAVNSVAAEKSVRVAPALQAGRDAERRAILENELHTLLIRERELQSRQDEAGLAARLRTQDDLRALRAELARLPAG